MAKRTIGGTKKTSAGETKTATSEPKARRAPARRRTVKKSDAPIATASELAQPERVEAAPAVDHASTPYTPSADDVSRRAYEIYCGRGYTHGNDVEDWLEAERQLRDARTH